MKFLSLPVLLLSALPLCAQDLVSWGEAGSWDILVDPTLGNGCLIQSEFEDGSIVRIGFDNTEDGGYVTVFNAAWGDIVAGQDYPISFALDGETYEGTGTGIYLANEPGIDIAFDSVDFLFDIARKYTMTLYHDGDEVMAIDLEGSYAGLEGMLACQDEQD